MQLKACESIPSKKQLLATISMLAKQPTTKIAKGIKQVPTKLAVAIKQVRALLVPCCASIALLGRWVYWEGVIRFVVSVEHAPYDIYCTRFHQSLVF